MPIKKLVNWVLLLAVSLTVALVSAEIFVRVAASILGLSAKTVDAHKFNLMRKLGIHNKAELVMWAIQKRVVKMPAS